MSRFVMVVRRFSQTSPISSSLLCSGMNSRLPLDISNMELLSSFKGFRELKIFKPQANMESTMVPIRIDRSMIVISVESASNSLVSMPAIKIQPREEIEPTEPVLLLPLRSYSMSLPVGLASCAEKSEPETPTTE